MGVADRYVHESLILCGWRQSVLLWIRVDRVRIFRHTGLFWRVVSKVLLVVGSQDRRVDIACAVSALVVVNYHIAVGVAGEVQVHIIFAEHGAKWDVIPSEACIAFDQSAGEVWHEEDISDGEHSEEYSQDDTTCLTGTEFFQRWCSWSLDYNSVISNHSNGNPRLQIFTYQQ